MTMGQVKSAIAAWFQTESSTMNKSIVPHVAWQTQCRFAACSVMLTAAIGSGGAMGASLPDELAAANKSWRAAGLSAWQERIRPEFMKVADAATKEVLDRVSFRIVDIGQSNAGANSANQQVAVDVGLLMMIDPMADAVVVTLAEPQCAQYVEAFPAQLGAVYLRRLRGDYTTRMPDFASLCGVPTARADSIGANERNRELKSTIITNWLALVVGHELGHLVKRDPPADEIPVADSQAHEYAADAFALQLVHEARFVPVFGGAAIFEMLNLQENPSGKATHPPASCRLARLLDGPVNALYSRSQLGSLRLWGIKPQDIDRVILETTHRCELSASPPK